MTMRLSPVMTSADLPEAELWALCRDGELDHLGEGFVPIDLPVTAGVRANALSPLLPPKVVVERYSAAWVHGVLDELPPVRSLAVRHNERVAVARSWRVVVREVVFHEGDIESIGGIEVTTPARTALDLARQKAFRETDLPLVARLLDQAGIDLAECRAQLDRTKNLPDKRAALRRLTDALLLNETARMRASG